jgi:hypothetical protein
MVVAHSDDAGAHGGNHAHRRSSCLLLSTVAAADIEEPFGAVSPFASPHEGGGSCRGGRARAAFGLRRQRGRAALPPQHG